MVAVRDHDERTVIQYAQRTVRGELPEEFDWVRDLTSEHLIQFAVELKDALARMGVSGSNAEVIELLDAWEATAEIDADPDLAASLQRPREERNYVDWVPDR
jgi:hypothetical protein